MFIGKMLKFDYGSIVIDKAEIYALDLLFGQVKFTAACADYTNLFLMNKLKVVINFFDLGAIVG